jgi:translation initiation factor IF-2
MNNNRVRIYDLSKELHLENKQLLAICNELNIAAKSHSSTIIGADAERLRAVAEKQVAVRRSAKKAAATTPLAHVQGASKAQSQPSLSHKQQILEIRQLKTLDRTHSNPQQLQVAARSQKSLVGSPTPPRPYSPPTSPTKPVTLAQPLVETNQPKTKLNGTNSAPQTQEAQISAKINAVSEQAQLAPAPLRSVPPVAVTPQLSQPEPSKPEGNRVKESPHKSEETTTTTATQKPARRQPVAPTSQQETPKPQPVLELQRPKPASANQPETPVATHPSLTALMAEPQAVAEKSQRQDIAPEAPAVLEKPQLAQPPARPAPPVAPTLAPSQSEQSGQQRAKVKPVVKKSVETTTETVVQKPARRKKVASTLEQETPKAPSVIELQRPKPVRSSERETPPVATRPKLSVVTAESRIAQAEPDSVALAGEPELLERPKLLRPTKPSKTRQNEEIDEEQDAKAKAGKAGSKVKRLKPIIEDEEEDWLDTELDLDAPQASLAIARPAKPKGSAVKLPANVALIATTTKRKKSGNLRDRNRHDAQPKRERPEQLVITGSMTVQELAEALVVQDTEIIKILFLKGMAVSITQSLDISTINLIAEELGVQIETAQPEAAARKVTEMLDVEDLENLQRRPPVVTIMGHVDHGKTSLLDSIRHTRVAQGEAGGITQHIGAYHVDVESDGKVQQVVFLDTPGHEAFTAMRARGARVTDIAILVVAADDGVQPQTVEAISHAKAAEVPIIVAINKIDKPEAQPDRVKQELTEYGLVPEEWGGDTIMVPVSAIQGENLDTLLEMILLVAEVADLQANPERLAKGTVIEANLDRTRGPVATFLVQNGTLQVGDTIVAGSSFGKVRAMIDDRGHRVKAATPSFAVEVLGLSDVPAAGDEFEVFQHDKEARAIATERADQQRQTRLMQRRVSLTTLSAQAQKGELKELNLILKADVQGSVEAIVGALEQVPQNQVQLRLLLAAPGEITETDIDLASASNAVIIGFNTTLASGARQAADAAGVDVRDYNIIYKLLEDIQGAMEGLLEPELVEEALGQVEVRAVFSIGRGKIAGCYVLSGKVVRNCKVRVSRGGQVVYQGTLDSLKRMKDDVKEVNAGYECGIGIDKFNDWVEGDLIDTYQMVTKRRTLSAAK